MYRLSPAPRELSSDGGSPASSSPRTSGYEGFDSRAGSCHEGLSTSARDQRESLLRNRIYHTFSGSIFSLVAKAFPPREFIDFRSFVNSIVIIRFLRKRG